MQVVQIVRLMTPHIWRSSESKLHHHPETWARDGTRVSYLYSDSTWRDDASPNSAPDVPRNVRRSPYDRRLCTAKPLGHTRRQNREVHNRHGAQVGRRRLHK